MNSHGSGNTTIRFGGKLSLSSSREPRGGIRASHLTALVSAARGYLPPEGWRSRRFPELAGRVARTDRRILQKARSRVAALALALYLATLSIDAIRKVMGLPASVIGVVYVIIIVIYIIALPVTAGRGRATPPFLPLLLLMVSAWCFAVALIQHIPLEMALLGWASYVFFVPLLYVGAELAADDNLAAKALRVVVIGGGVVGVGAIASAILGQSAPALLRPINQASGVHSFGVETIYLAPSIFANAEEASEQLLIALFAWAALAQLADGRSRRRPWMLVGVLIASGLFVAARRTDIDVAIAGIIGALMLGRIRMPASAERFATRVAGRPPSRLGATIFLAAAASVALIFFLGEARLASFLASGSPASRISGIFLFPSTGPLTGQGPGTSTQGLTVVGSSLPVAQGVYSSYVLNGRTFLSAEGGLAKTWLELGIIGVALYGAIFWMALAPAIRSLRRLDGAGVALTMLAIALGVIFLKGHQSLDDPLIQPLFWLGVGGIWGRMRAVEGVPSGRNGEGVAIAPY